MKNDILRVAYLLSLRVNPTFQSCTYQRVSSMFLRMEFWKLNANSGDYSATLAALVHDDLITISNRRLLLPQGGYSYQALDKSYWIVIADQDHVYASPENLWTELRNGLRLPVPRGQLIINPYGMYCGKQEHAFITMTDKGTDIVNVSVEDFTCEP